MGASWTDLCGDCPREGARGGLRNVTARDACSRARGVLPLSCFSGSTGYVRTRSPRSLASTPQV
uniref:Uncharacterized protein n=1 Tax=Anguilla anguilla TaxID=7936 RepID=A0A0E9R5N6_ANGAN